MDDSSNESDQVLRRDEVKAAEMLTGTEEVPPGTTESSEHRCVPPQSFAGLRGLLAWMQKVPQSWMIDVIVVTLGAGGLALGMESWD